MKPVLVLALGNPLAGDDALGCELVQRLAADAAVRARADLVCGGTDLLRQAAALSGRRRVIVVDAALSDAAAPRVRAVPHPPAAADRRSHAHALDPVGALTLLRALEPEVAAAETWWLLVEVPELALAPGLSPDVAALLPQALAALRQLVLEPVPDP